ncbi:hypothetical protein DCO49_04125 [Stenotrophomonas sp. SPM]|nr:hypothetical protein DCO49_04125 [Stenotrophomonas sp. SPM]
MGWEWTDEPVEPVRRDLTRGAGLVWAAGKRVRLHQLCTWVSSRPLALSAAIGWSTSQSLGLSAGLAWQASSVVKRSLISGWHTEMAGRAMVRDMAWTAMRACDREVSAPWISKLPSHRSARLLAWRHQGFERRGVGLCWGSDRPTVGAFAAASWRHLGLSRVAATLRWGIGRGLPWGVRPKPSPIPEPEPSPFASGGRVPLALGCDPVAAFAGVPLNLGVSACYLVRPHRRTYVVINTVSLVRLPDRTRIEVTRVSLGASRGTWGWTFDIELADPQQLALLKPTATGPRQFEVALNGYVWTGIIESFQRQREFSGGGVRLSGRSRTALLAAPYAPARVKATTEERSMAQLVAEELADTGFTSEYDTVDWNVPAGAWFYDASTPLDAISALAEASGGVVQSDPAALAMRVRAAYPASPWDWRTTPPDHVLQEDIVLTESLQMRSAPLYDAVVVTGEVAGKGVTCKVRRSGEEGRLYAQQVSSPLISVPAAGAERGRNILCDRGEQAAVDLTVPLFAQPLKPGEVGLVLPLDLVEVVGADGTWHGQCESLRIEVSADDQAVVIEQTATLERHYTDAD